MSNLNLIVKMGKVRPISKGGRDNRASRNFRSFSLVVNTSTRLTSLTVRTPQAGLHERPGLIYPLPESREEPSAILACNSKTADKDSADPQTGLRGTALFQGS